MISNERRWPSHNNFQRQPYYDRPQAPVPRPTLREDTLESREIQIERKHFLAMLKENPRGRFLRISEETNGRYNSIMIPGDGLQEFLKMLESIVQASETIPSVNQPPDSDVLP